MMLFYVLAILILSTFVDSQSDAKPVVNISAKGGMEIDDVRQTIEAHQDIVVKRGTQRLYADHAKAHFEKVNQTKPKVVQLIAWGQVIMEDSDGKIYGERALYDIPKDTIILTGSPILFIGKDMKIEAYDRLIYSPKAKTAQAIGSVKIERENQTLMADEVIAYFEEDEKLTKEPSPNSPNYLTRLKKMNAKGNVKIILPDQVASANYGEHDQGKTYLEGDVKLSSKEGQIQGGYGEITEQGISRVLQHKPGYDKSNEVKDADRVQALILRE